MAERKRIYRHITVASCRQKKRYEGFVDNANVIRDRESLE